MLAVGHVCSGMGIEQCRDPSVCPLVPHFLLKRGAFKAALKALEH